MTKVLNTFTKAVMLKDMDMSLIPQDSFRHAENLRFSINNGDDGIGNNIRGSLKVSDATDGNSDYKCICAYFDKDTDSIYYYLATSTGQLSKIVEYNNKTGNTVEVLSDDRGLLNFDKDGYITGVNEINGLLIWSEWGNNIRRINVERAKTYGLNGFNEEDITLLVKPPKQKLDITLRTSTTLNKEENNIEDKMFAFSYRYRFLDGEYSALAPFTNYAFKPKEFLYDYQTQSNKAMINRFNEVLIKFDTGNHLVTEIQLVFIQSDTLEGFIIDDFDKEMLGWGDNEERSFVFNNLKSIRALPKQVLDNYFDNIPRTAKAQTLIDARLISAHYKENYDIRESEGGAKIELDYDLELISNDVTITSARPTVKSLRDYEVVVVYKDEYFRATTALRSKTNTIFVKNSLNTKENKIVVNLKNKPPYWAKYFQFFIRQNGKDYEQFIPIIFYEEDDYRWIKIEDSDIDKIKKGDYFYIKSDTRGLRDTPVKVKILEVGGKERNFLDTTNSTDLLQQAGFYVKVKQDGFSLDTEDISEYRFDGFEWSNRDYYPIKNNTNVIQPAIFYGQGENDITVGGTYTSSVDKSFKVEITESGNGTTTFDKFMVTQGSTTIIPEQEINETITYNVADGITISFADKNNHIINDHWFIRAKSANELSQDWDSRALGIFKGSDEDFISAGAVIVLKYDEYAESNQYVENTFTSNGNYANLEEWFYGDDIDQYFASKGIPSTRIYFRRGTVGTHGVKDPENFVDISSDGTTGTMNMMISSTGYENNGSDGSPTIRTTISIRNLSTPIIFESVPNENSKDIFYEIGSVYSIENGFHKGLTSGDTDQTSSTDLQVVLDWFNAWTFGNGVESYKLYDEFNQKGLDEGVRTTSTTKEEYKEIIRTADISWSDVYNDDSNFNGLSTFNLSLINFITLDKENGSIQKLHNSNGNLMVLQEEGVGLIPYNKNIIQDTEGSRVVGIATNILNKESYRPYQHGKVGISKNPESFVADGARNYFTDKQRGNFIRLSINGVTETNEYQMEHEFSDLMVDNRDKLLITGFDPKHKEILLYLPSEEGNVVFKERPLGFQQYIMFEPDFMLNADNEFYAWKNGVMYRMNATENRNEFFGEKKESKIVFSVNHSFGVEKVFRALGIYSTHSWLAKLKTKLTSRDIPRDCFEQKENMWYSEIMGNTNDNKKSNSIFGIGSYEIVNGEINTIVLPASISVGDYVSSKSLLFPPIRIKSIEGKKIILDSNISTVKSFLQYSKNQNIDGGDIRGDFMEVELINNDSEKVELRAVSTEISKSHYS